MSKSGQSAGRHVGPSPGPGPTREPRRERPTDIEVHHKEFLSQAVPIILEEPHAAKF